MVGLEMIGVGRCLHVSATTTPTGHLRSRQPSSPVQGHPAAAVAQVRIMDYWDGKLGGRGWQHDGVTA